MVWQANYTKWQAFNELDKELGLQLKKLKVMKNNWKIVLINIWSLVLAECAGSLDQVLN